MSSETGSTWQIALKDGALFLMRGEESYMVAPNSNEALFALEAVLPLIAQQERTIAELREQADRNLDPTRAMALLAKEIREQRDRAEAAEQALAAAREALRLWADMEDHFPHEHVAYGGRIDEFDLLVRKALRLLDGNQIDVVATQDDSAMS